MNCPKCTGEYRVKNGVLNEKQRYNCKGCGNNYTVSRKSTAKLLLEPRLGLMMYLEGLGFHYVGKLPGGKYLCCYKMDKKIWPPIGKNKERGACR